MTILQILRHRHHLGILFGISWLRPRHEYLSPEAYFAVTLPMGIMSHHLRCMSALIFFVLQVFNSKPHLPQREGMKFGEIDPLQLALLGQRYHFPPFPFARTLKHSAIIPVVIWDPQSRLIGSTQITSPF